MNDRARNLARVEPRQIQVRGEEPNPFAAYQPLDRYTGERVELPDAPSFIATISAGFKNDQGRPVVSRDGTIHVVDPGDRAPFLREQLKASGGKRLTIAFTSNDPREIVQERFVSYTQTALLAHGDDRSLTVLDGKGGRQVLQAGTPGYKQAIAKCMVTRSVYFVLAGWDEQNRPRMIFDPRDGFAHYRLRFGSRNSLSNILRQLGEVASHTNGEIAGLPFELSITYRDTADPTGKRNNVPVWSIVFKPPQGIVLDARAFRTITSQAIEEGRQLSLPAPSAETIDLAASEFREIVDDETILTDEKLDQMQRGTPVDADAARARWFAIARGTRFADKDGRESWISSYTAGTDKSLKDIIGKATNEEMAATLDTLQRCIEDGERLPKAWEGLPGVDDDEDTDPGDMGEDGWGGEPESPEDVIVERYRQAPPEPAPEPAATPVEPDDLSRERRKREIATRRWAEVDSEARELGIDVAPLAHDAPTDEIVRRGKELAGQIKTRREQPAPEPEPQVEPDLPMDVDLPIEDDEDPFA